MKNEYTLKLVHQVLGGHPPRCTMCRDRFPAPRCTTAALFRFIKTHRNRNGTHCSVHWGSMNLVQNVTIYHLLHLENFWYQAKYCRHCNSHKVATCAHNLFCSSSQQQHLLQSFAISAAADKVSGAKFPTFSRRPLCRESIVLLPKISPSLNFAVKYPAVCNSHTTLIHALDFKILLQLLKVS